MQHVWKPGYGSLPTELLGLFPLALKFGVVLEMDHEIIETLIRLELP